MKFGLSDSQLEVIIKILFQFDEIESAMFFGSRAMNNHKEASDVDISLKGNKVTTEIANKVRTMLEDTSLPFFFDVLNYNSVRNEQLKTQIDSNGVEFFSRISKSET